MLNVQLLTGALSTTLDWVLSIRTICPFSSSEEARNLLTRHLFYKPSKRLHTSDPPTDELVTVLISALIS